MEKKFIHFDFDENGTLSCTNNNLTRMEMVGLMFFHITKIIQHTNIVEKKKTETKMEKEIKSTGFNPENIVNTLQRTKKKKEIDE